MDLIFIAPSTRHPSGGVAMIYEFAGAMAARGHRVHLYHVPFLEADATSLADVGWFEFTPSIEHHFQPPGPPDLDSIPEADFIFGFQPDTPARAGLPLVLIQGYEMLDDRVEEASFGAPCPKVCVARWLVDQARALGVPARELVHVPLGLRHDEHRLTRPVTGRPLRVSCCYSPHMKKGTDIALRVMELVRAQVPDVDVTFFGAVPPIHDLPDWVTYHLDPPRERLVDEIYNTSRIFLCASRVEGFGLTNIEAMASGAALVTTDNGGSQDYAIHMRTALVAPVDDVAGLAAHVTTLLSEEPLRVEIADAGRRHVEQFSWEHSAQRLEAFLERYAADPVAHGRPASTPAPRSAR